MTTMTTKPVRVLGLAGSLRDASFNRALLRGAGELTPPGVEITTFDELGALPFYDGDVEAAGEPDAVRALGTAIDAADAILIVTPEYNDGTLDGRAGRGVADIGAPYRVVGTHITHSVRLG